MDCQGVQASLDGHFLPQQVEVDDLSFRALPECLLQPLTAKMSAGSVKILSGTLKYIK